MFNPHLVKTIHLLKPPLVWLFVYKAQTVQCGTNKLLLEDGGSISTLQ